MTILLASLVTIALLLAVAPASASGSAAPAAHDHAAPAEAGPEPHGECDANGMARDEMRRATNPVVFSVMTPRPGCPAFAALETPAAEAAAHGEAAAAPASGH